ncbi:DUF3263 domain-containing protein [Calidifontibacter sp. DB0510]|uniref:DUF3263 domain-containing protein n=1 Tax=Metallococcus carri TaxID=1656884 RepID=A0A967B060_9MICO|nr:DUF3263 domain-containing protein [Metallococcus carri]NHN55584.1 DUF3263 domain-containing protein [Metallococcus carri]NOP38232.1 DUF3263 domain-containing protein [Calidifontibacter sp. DB2511S]
MGAAEQTVHTDGAELSAKERQILDFERTWFKLQGSKEDAIREQLGLSSTRYYQALNALIDNPEALKADALLVKRLRRLRAARMRQRNARRLGFDD